MPLYPRPFQCAASVFTAAVLAAGGAAAAQDTDKAARPPGEEKTIKTKALELGAKALQQNVTLADFDSCLVGFHPLKDKPEHQMEAHHWCMQVNEDFAQCVLFDGNTESANLNGVEYIISEKLFESL